MRSAACYQRLRIGHQASLPAFTASRLAGECACGLSAGGQPAGKAVAGGGLPGAAGRATRRGLRPGAADLCGAAAGRSRRGGGGRAAACAAARARHAAEAQRGGDAEGETTGEEDGLGSCSAFALLLPRCSSPASLSPPQSSSSTRKDALALLAYEDPQTSPSAWLFGQEVRTETAAAVNRAILRRAGRQECSAVESAVAQTEALCRELAAEGCVAAQLVTVHQALEGRLSGAATASDPAPNAMQK